VSYTIFMDKDKKPTPIDVDKIDLDKMKEKTADLPGLLDYAHSVGGFAVVPTEKGVIRGRALKMMEGQTQRQMDQIFEQMKLLAKQANGLKERAEVSMQIYNADINFDPVLGEIYFLYEKKDGVRTLSLIGPDEWKKEMPFKEFIAKVQLLADHTWDILESN